VKLESLPRGVRLAVEAAQEKKAAGITVLDLTAAGAFTDYFVVCTGFSTPQVQAICTEVEEQLHKKLSRSPQHREGHRSAEWALLDFGGFVVHVFSEQARRYYDLERLWRMAPKLELPDQPDGHSSERSLSDPQFGHEQHYSGEAASSRPQSGRSRQ
jgi:ribosome-associated protein